MTDAGKALITWLCLFSSSALRAQVPADVSFFQPPSSAERSMQQCVFDPEADAVLLFDKAWAYYNDEGNMLTEHHVRLKILRESGVHAADIEIPYYADKNFETITDVRAAVWNGDDQAVWMDKKAVYVRKANALYNITVFTVPHAGVGSVVEYAYVVTAKSISGLTKWEFQHHLPVMKSYFQVKMMPMVEFSYTVKKNPGNKVNLIPDQAENTMSFSMDNVQGLRDEPFMDARQDYLQRVNFQLSAVNKTGDRVGTTNYSKTYAQSWSELNTELLMDENYGGALSKTLDLPPTLTDMLAKNKEPMARIRFILDHVRTSMKWNRFISVTATDNIRKIYADRTGTATEINLILINLLRAAGIDAKPVLASERSHGMVDTLYPIKEQFNLTVASIDLQGKRYILDATDPTTPAHIIPLALVHTRAFLVDRKMPGFFQIPDNGITESSTINLMSSIDAAGKLNGEATIYDLGYAKLSRLSEYLHAPKTYGFKWSSPAMALVKVDHVEVDGAQGDSSILQTRIGFHGELTSTGGYIPVRYDLFSEMDQNPFTSELRMSDINFGSRRSFTLNADHDLDPSWMVETMPKNLKLVSPDQSMTLTRLVRQDGQNLSIVLKFECTRTRYLAAEYDEVRGFYRKMVEVFSEPVMLKKR